MRAPEVCLGSSTRYFRGPLGPRICGGQCCADLRMPLLRPAVHSTWVSVKAWGLRRNFRTFGFRESRWRLREPRGRRRRKIIRRPAVAAGGRCRRVGSFGGAGEDFLVPGKFSPLRPWSAPTPAHREARKGSHVSRLVEPGVLANPDAIYAARSALLKLSASGAYGCGG